MKKIFAAAIAVLGITSVASAADLPVYKAPPAVAPVDNWTGFYIGGNIGGMAATSDRSSSADPTFWSTVVPALNASGTAKLTGTAVVGGLQAGYNWQTGPFVLGIEADIDSSHLNASSDTGILAPPPTSPGLGTYRFAYSVHTDWTATLRGRAGWTVQNSLFYVTGGAAWTNIGQTGHAEFDSGCGGPNPACDSDTSSSTTRTGWVVGGGVEYKLNTHWSSQRGIPAPGLRFDVCEYAKPWWFPWQLIRSKHQSEGKHPEVRWELPILTEQLGLLGLSIEQPRSFPFKPSAPEFTRRRATSGELAYR